MTKINNSWKMAAAFILVAAAMLVVMCIVQESDHVAAAEMVREADVYPAFGGDDSAAAASGSMATSEGNANEVQQLPNAKGKDGSQDVITMLSQPDGQPEAGSAADLEREVERAMKVAASHAEERAKQLGVTKAEADYAKWKASATAKQEVIEAALAHSQRVALRHADQKVTECAIRERNARDHASVLAAKADEDDEHQSAVIEKVTSDSTPEAKFAFDVWKQFRTDAAQSLQASEAAKKQSTDMTIKCAEANANKLHIQHLIKRAAARIEKVKAKLVSEFATRAKLAGQQATKERKDKDLQTKDVLNKFQQQVDGQQAAVDRADKKVSKATALIATVKSQLEAAKKDSDSAAATVDDFKGQLNQATDTLDLATSVQTSAAKQTVGAQLQALATKLTVAAKKKKRRAATVLRFQKQLQRAKLALKMITQKREQEAAKLEDLQTELAQKKLASEMPVQSIFDVEEEAVDIAMVQGAPDAGPGRESTSARQPERAQTVSIEVRDEGVPEKQESPSRDAATVSQALQEKVQRSDRENAHMLQNAMRELEEAEGKGADIEVLVETLARLGDDTPDEAKHPEAPRATPALEESESRPDLLLIEENGQTMQPPPRRAPRRATAGGGHDSTAGGGHDSTAGGAHDSQHAHQAGRPQDAQELLAPAKPKHAENTNALILKGAVMLRQQETSQADAKLKSEMQKLQALEKKKETVHATTQAHLQTITDTLTASEAKSQQAESDAKKRLAEKLARIKATLQEQLFALGDTSSPGQ